MTRLVDIWHSLLTNVKPLVKVKALFRVLVLSLFVYGQAAWASHDHNHEHGHEDEPHETACIYCVLTTSDEEILADDADLPDEPEFLDSIYANSATLLFRDILLTSDQRDNLAKPLPLDRRSDAVRAPPYP